MFFIAKVSLYMARILKVNYTEFTIFPVFTSIIFIIGLAVPHAIYSHRTEEGFELQEQ